MGYLRVRVPAGSYAWCGMPFDTGSASIQAVLDGQLTAGTSISGADQVLKWDPQSQSYVTAYKLQETASAPAQWMEKRSDTLEPSSLTLAAGDGFVLVNRQQTEQVVTLLGRLVLEPTQTRVITPGLNFFSYPFTTAMDLESTMLEACGGTSEAVTDPAGAPASWLRPGAGYWYQRTGGEALAWSEVRPYAADYADETEPAVVALQDDQKNARCTVTMQSPSAMRVDVYVKDVTQGARLDTQSGWVAAATGLQLQPGRAATWIDETATANGRLYKVVPAGAGAGVKAHAKAGQILVKPKAGAAEADFQNLLSSHGARQRDVIHQIGVRVVTVPADKADTVLAALSHNPTIEFAEPDYLAESCALPNDPYYASEWHMAKIGAPAAWDVTKGTSTVIVAVVDTGVAFNHPDLQGKILPGYDFADNDADATDCGSHGTGVAGVIGAATDNGVGVPSVGWRSVILPLKDATAGSSTISYSVMAQCVTYAADHGARVINISQGGTASSSTLQSALDYAWSKNAVLVAAAGNYSTNTPLYPAACRNVLAVSATTSADTLYSYSNFGSYVDLAAPGDVWTTYVDSSNPSSLYIHTAGTSFSSPIVAGVAALVIAARPDLSNAQVVSLLCSTAVDLGAAGRDDSFGYGLVSASAAVSAAVGGAAPAADTTVPVAIVDSPTAGTVAGSVSVAVHGTDNVAVTKVEYYVNNVLKGSSATASATFTWDSTSSVNGTVSLVARAYDAAGNVGASAPVSVSVQNAAPAPDTVAPTASITSPAPGSTVASSQKIIVTSSDDIRVARVELWIDGALFGTSTTASTTFTWSTRKAAKGAHSLQAKAYDAAGNVGSSAVVTVYK